MNVDNAASFFLNAFIFSNPRKTLEDADYATSGLYLYRLIST